MNSLAKKEYNFTAIKVTFTNDMICLELADGREVRAPLVFYPRLLNATGDQRMNYRLIADGEGIHWSDINEDLSVESIVLGRKAA